MQEEPMFHHHTDSVRPVFVVFLYGSSSIDAAWMGDKVGVGGTHSGVDSANDNGQRVGGGCGFHGGEGHGNGIQRRRDSSRLRR